MTAPTFTPSPVPQVDGASDFPMMKPSSSPSQTSYVESETSGEHCEIWTDDCQPHSWDDLVQQMREFKDLYLASQRGVHESDEEVAQASGVG